MKILISGLVNIETTLKISKFPIEYYPVNYPFFGIHSNVSGVAYNLSKALKTLGDEARLVSFIGNDEEGVRVLKKLEDDSISSTNIIKTSGETPASVILYDGTGRRQIHCDLKDLQEREVIITESLLRLMEECSLVVPCNINFSRPVMRKAKELGKLIAVDVHVLNSIDDPFNKEFIENADILFLSDEQLPCVPAEFSSLLFDRYGCPIIVTGMGKKGAMLYESGKCVMIDAVKTDRVVNTVGAGDALFSAFLHFFLKGFTPADALMRAQAFAALKIGFNGASNGFCSEVEVEKMLELNKPAIHVI